MTLESTVSLITVDCSAVYRPVILKCDLPIRIQPCRFCGCGQKMETSCNIIVENENWQAGQLVKVV